MSQKAYIIAAHEAAKGSKAETIDIYATLDAAGIAPRESNIRPLNSHGYAVIMYHTALKLGWI